MHKTANVLAALLGRLERGDRVEGAAAVLGVIGVRADGRKDLVALADGYRESTESWADTSRAACEPLRTTSRRPSSSRIFATALGSREPGPRVTRVR